MTIKEMRSTIDSLVTAYQDTRNNSETPRETARKFIRDVGAGEAAQCVAAMIRRAAWDGRISREAKAWANNTPLSGEWERHIEDTYCDAIHAAHLSQIAEAMPNELEFCAAEQEQEPLEQEPQEQEPLEQEPLEQEPLEQEPLEQEPQEQEPQAREWDGAALAAAMDRETPPLRCMYPTAMPDALHADLKRAERQHAPGVTCRLNRSTWRVEYVDPAGNVVR